MIKIEVEKKLKGAQEDFELVIDEIILKNEVVALFGKSGTGKTTFLRILSGLETALKGRLEVDNKTWLNTDKKICLPTSQRNIGFVSQESVLFPNMNVKDQLTFSKGKFTDFELLEKVISIMKIENLLKSYPSTLSGGQKQRICLARAIIQKPTILLLDEPFTALDYEMREQLIGLTQKVIKEYQLTTIFVSHHPSEIIQLATKVWRLNNGKVIGRGVPQVEMADFL